MRLYRISGLLVQSEFALPGGIPIAAETPADVAIRYGPVPEDLREVTASGRAWQTAGNQFLLRIPDVARFLLTDGREIVVEPASEASAADVPRFVLGSVFGLLQHQRGNIVLHASAVCVNGQAVLFCGRSGAGKSTLAAALALRGYPPISDDICAISLTEDNEPVVHADGRQLKLSARDIERFGLSERRRTPAHQHTGKYSVDFGGGFSKPIPIASVYDLQDAPSSSAPNIVRPNIVDAALMLRQHAFRGNIVERTGQWPAYFRAAAAIANSAAMYHLRRPFDLSQLPELLGSLEQHWLDTRLLDPVA